MAGNLVAKMAPDVVPDRLTCMPLRGRRAAGSAHERVL